MSLLLDALKKAAQKKAEKNLEHSEAVDAADSTNIDKTIAVTRYDETAIIDPELTDHATGQIDQNSQFTDESTKIDATDIDQTVLTGTSALDHEATLIDQDTQFSTDATKIDATVIDQTVLTNTQVLDHEATQIDPDNHFTPDTTTIDATVISQPEITDEDVDSAINETIEFEFDPTQLIRGADLEAESLLTEEDKSLYIFDDIEEESKRSTQTAKTVLTDTQTIPPVSRYRQKEEDSLTTDDVTQFMGDGYSESGSSGYSQSDITGEDSDDDTTATNSEALELTNFNLDEINSEGSDSTNFQLEDLQPTGFLHDNYVNSEDDNKTQISRPSYADISEDDKSTLIRTDSTSTISSVDIEKLTNDETVTVGSRTTTKTFAPDNYDRTLLNLSDQDVSKIFPGMQPEAGAAMTPDYAKRVFLSKSGQIKTPYYKIYAGIGVVLLLIVIMLGLFELQTESDLLDQRLVSLKRDPMPGIIKPQTEKPAPRLFASTPVVSDIKSADILSKAENSTVDQPYGNEQQEALSNMSYVEETTGTGVDEGTEKLSAKQVSSDNQPVKNTGKKTKSRAVQAKSQSVSSLAISSRNMASEKNQLLADAYKAYEQSDMLTARTLYDNVLALDEASRDGLLGRAAIHIQDNEYQLAINKYQQLLVSNPKDSMAMASLISVANIEPQVGETQLKSLLREQPDSAYLHFALGNMFGSQNRWNEAQDSYFTALQNKPDDPNYAYNLAVSLEHIGKSSSSVTFYQRALDNSDKGLVTFNSQLVKERLGVLAQ